MKKQRSEDKGITLVALVVTIIVLIILAVVTLNIVLDNDGIINKTKEGAKEYENAQKEEQELLGEIKGYIEYAGKTAQIPEGYTKSQITTEDDVAEGLVIYEIPEGATVNWTDEEDENGNNQSTITIGDTTTNLQETVNQYVWIPVEDINSMVMCKSNTGDSICNLKYDEKTNILACANSEHSDTAADLVGRLYVGISSENTTDEEGNRNFSHTMDFTKRDQTYDEIDGYREPAIVNDDELENNYHGLENADAFLNQLKSDFTEMATSVAKNRGFYISRYEIGANGISKKGEVVLTAADEDGENYLGANMWYGLYNTCRNESRNTQMIWGCQYDQVIKFIGNEAQIGHSDRNLTTIRALSGQNDLDKMKNIYDLEGNLWEKTLEAYSTTIRIGRSSGYATSVDNRFYPVSFRNTNSGSGPTNTNYNHTTRSILYL